MGADPEANRGNVRVAIRVAKLLQEEKVSENDGIFVLAMALGIFVESWADSHRYLEPLVTGMLEASQVAFDALRAGRLAGAADKGETP